MIQTCPDCESFPPRIVMTELSNGDFGCECRDCGGYWEELSNPQDFFQNNHNGMFEGTVDTDFLEDQDEI